MNTSAVSASPNEAAASIAARAAFARLAGGTPTDESQVPTRRPKFLWRPLGLPRLQTDPGSKGLSGDLRPEARHPVRVTRSQRIAPGANVPHVAIKQNGNPFSLPSAFRVSLVLRPAIV